MLADAAAQRNDLDALQAYAPRAEAIATQCGHPLYLAIARRALSVAHRLAGEHAESAARLAQSLSLFEELGARWQQGRTWLEMGELARVQQETAAARSHFERARALFEEMGARPDAERAEASLNALP